MLPLVCVRPHVLAEAVQTNNHADGRRIRALSSLWKFEQVPSYSPHHLVSQKLALEKIVSML